jgi:hypothetical protein
VATCWPEASEDLASSRARLARRSARDVLRPLQEDLKELDLEDL